MPSRKDILAKANVLSDRLRTWQPVDEFRRTISELENFTWQLENLPGKKEGHRERESKGYREAWVLEHFFDTYEVTWAKLLPEPEERGDAEIRSKDGTTCQVEVTEALSAEVTGPDVPEEKRVSSRKPPGLVHQDEGPGELRRRAKEIPKLVEDAILKKRNKPYASDTILLIHLSAAGGGTPGVNPGEVKASIQAVVSREERAFRAVHVLWNNRIYGTAFGWRGAGW